ncbi:MAG: aspartate aminotransferase family protein [Spirochaetota bacterium]|nr:MAG: aspartate aminotransferase family protein [Spirochaetota bacterium]
MNGGKKPGEKRKLPGKRSAELLKLRNKYVPKAVFQVAPVFIDRGKGAIIEDVDGNEYIDFVGGICVLNAGQSNEFVISAIKEQLDKHLHADHNVTMYEVYMRLAEKLTKITPGNYQKQVLFSNSGAEGIENAVKIARRYTGRHGLICFEGAFHGRTAMTMGLTSQVRNYKYGFGPFDPGIYRFPFAYAYRAPFGLSADEYGEYCVAKIEESFKSYIASDEVAAIILEPIPGEGGYMVPPKNFIQGLRRICDKNGILLIDDEIQVGMGRTGKMWSIENYNVTPDIMVIAKSLGGGIPIAATVAKKEYMDAVPLSGLGGTFNGNPVSCAAALKVLEYYEKENLLQKAAKFGKMAMDRLEKMKGKYPVIGDVRGIGCAIGLEVVKDHKTKEPDAQMTSIILKECHEHGLIIMSCGAYHNIIRFMFPLVIKEDELRMGFDILENALKAQQK